MSCPDAYEQATIPLAHRQRFLSRLEAHAQVTADVPQYSGDGIDVDERAATDLPEYRRVDGRGNLTERSANRRLALGRHDSRELVVGLEVADFVDGDEPDFVAIHLADVAAYIALANASRVFVVRSQ